MNRLPALAVAAVIPWIPTAPPRPHAPTPAQQCSLARLHADLELQGATGSLVGGVTLTNRGSAACSLTGRPRAHFIGGSDPAGVMARSIAALAPTTPGGDYSSLRSLRDGESANVTIVWSNWCGIPTPTGLALTVSGLALNMKIGGTRFLPRGAAARCDNPSGPSTLGVGPLQPGEEHPDRATRLPLAARIVEHVIRKSIPGIRAHAGETAVFHVAVTNVSGRTFRFGHGCPSYIEGMGFDQPSREYVLNCRPVAEIKPRQTVTFEMRVDVPRTVKPGRLPLNWTLAPATYEPPFASGVILVAG